MSICIDYKDTINIVETSIDEYSTESIKSNNEVKALFSSTTGWSHSSNQDSIISDAHVYIDPKNAFVVSSLNRLEGMLVIASPFGGNTRDSWYRIIGVKVGQDKLLDNNIDNIRLDLKKSTEIYSVS